MEKIPDGINKIPKTRIKAISCRLYGIFFTFSVKLGKNCHYTAFAYPLVNKGVVTPYDKGVVIHPDYAVENVFSRAVSVQHYVVFMRFRVASFKEYYVSVGSEQRAHTRALGNGHIYSVFHKLLLYSAVAKAVLIHLTVHRPKAF